MDRGHGRLSSCALKARAWVAGEEGTEVVLLAGETSLWHRSTIARSTRPSEGRLREARARFLASLGKGAVGIGGHA